MQYFVLLFSRVMTNLVPSFLIFSTFVTVVFINVEYISSPRNMLLFTLFIDGKILKNVRLGVMKMTQNRIVESGHYVWNEMFRKYCLGNINLLYKPFNVSRTWYNLVSNGISNIFKIQRCMICITFLHLCKCVWSITIWIYEPEHIFSPGNKEMQLFCWKKIIDIILFRRGIVLLISWGFLYTYCWTIVFH